MTLKLSLKPDQRGAIIGMTGTGKSTLAEHVIPKSGKLAIIDPKRAFDYPDVPVFSSPRAIWKRKPSRFIYRPDPGQLTDLGALDDVYRYVYEAENTFLYTDDVVGICDQHRAPHFLKVCYMMGRSKNIACLASFQRPSLLPIYLMSEASKFYIFELVMPQDVKKCAAFVPGYDPHRLPDRHTFLYYDLTDKQMRRSMPVRLNLARR